MKKGKEVLLFIAATLFNLAVTAVLFFGLLALWGLALAPLLRLSSSSFVILCAFVLSVAGSALVYKAAVRLYLRRVSQGKDHPLTKS